MRRLVGVVLVVAFAGALVGGMLYVASNQRMSQVEREVAAGRRVRFTGPPPPFCVCHSKSAPMRKMHRAFGLADCTLCHHGKNMMDRTKRPKPSPAELKGRMASNAICRQCHRHPT